MTHQPTGKTKSDGNGKLRPYERWSVIINAGTFVAVIIAASIYYGQLTEMRKAVTVSRDTLEYSQRAWVGLDEIDKNPRVGFVADQPTPLQVWFKNFGNSPARQTDGVARFELQPVHHYSIPESPHYDPERWPIQHFVIQPGQRWAISDPYLTIPPMASDGVLQFTQGYLTLVVFGFIKYVDIFDKPHTTTFCLTETGDTNGLKFCDRYNTAD